MTATGPRPVRDRFEHICGQLPPGLTYRQIDHWITHYPAVFTAGCGQAGRLHGRRHFQPCDIEALTVMARLVDAGMTVAAAAAFAARGTRTGPLTPYVTIHVRHAPAP